MQRAVRIARPRRFRSDADGKASRPFARESTVLIEMLESVLIERLESGIHFAY